MLEGCACSQCRRGRIGPAVGVLTEGRGGDCRRGRWVKCWKGVRAVSADEGRIGPAVERTGGAVSKGCWQGVIEEVIDKGC